MNNDEHEVQDEETADKNKQSLIGVDPLAWLSDEEKQSMQSENKESQESTLNTEQAISSFTIKLPSALTIRDVFEFVEELNQIDDKHQELIFEAEDVDRIDTAAMQLLLGFYLFTTDAGKKVIWNKPSEALCHAVELLGLKELVNIKPLAA